MKVLLMYSVIYEDKPIKSIDEDLLNRKHIVEKLNHLISNNYSETFTIGLQGGWGLSKTSLINMVKNELSEEILILDFDPWIISNKSDIEETFFKEFKSILEENNFVFDMFCTCIDIQICSKSITYRCFLN